MQKILLEEQTARPLQVGTGSILIPRPTAFRMSHSLMIIMVLLLGRVVLSSGLQMEAITG